MVESTLYIFLVGSTGRSISSTMAEPCVLSEKCELPSRDTGYSRATEGRNLDVEN